MPNSIIIDGVSSENFSAYITDAGVFNSPSPDYEVVEIEGKNGDLIIDKNRFKNVIVRYPAVIYEDFESNFTALRSFLFSKKGYVRIEDTFVTDKFRLGRITGEITPKYPKDFQIGTFEINFYCKPQWYLKSGETAVEYSESGTIVNPTLYNSNPLIRVYGNGTLGINGETVVINEGADDYIDIDCEMMDCYEGSYNRNSLIEQSDWVKLAPGTNNIEIEGSITKIIITPRWFTL